MKPFQRYLLSFLSGGCAIFAYPPFSWWPVVFVAWPLLFLAVRGAGFRIGFRCGLLQGFVLFGITLSWFLAIFGILSVGLWLVLALFTGLACGFAAWASDGKRVFACLPLYVAVVWSALEYYRGEWFILRFSWMTPGMALGPTWLSPWIGVYGAGFFVVLAAALLVFGGKGSRVTGAALAAGLALLAVFRPGAVKEAGAGVPVLAVQSENLNPGSYAELTQGAEFRSGIVLWPEYAAPFYLRKFPGEWARVMKAAEEKDSVLVLGTWKEIEGERHYNEALTVDGGRELGSHFKNRPVHLMNDGEPGKTTLPVATRFGRLGTTICFDNDYTEVARRMTAAGAEMFTVPSMDAAGWSARQHQQHAEVFRHRALENGRWFAVAATSGMTQFVDPHGNRVSSLPLMTDGVLAGTIHPRTELTAFTRWGWGFPWLLTGVAVVWTAVRVIVRSAGFSPHERVAQEKEAG